MSINQRIKILRKELGLNQTEFGSRIAIAQGYLTNIENGHRDVTEKTIRLICLEFNVNETWLRTGEGEMLLDDTEAIINELAQKYDMDDLNRDIITLFLELPPEARKTAMAYFKFLAQEYKDNGEKK